MGKVNHQQGKKNKVMRYGGGGYDIPTTTMQGMDAWHFLKECYHE